MSAVGRAAALSTGMLLAVSALVAVGVAPAASAPTAALPAAAEAGRQPVSTEHAYPGDAKAESALVAAEERRLIDVRSLMSIATRLDLSNGRPYRLDVGAIPTLVLPEREAPYSMEELADMAPRSIARDDEAFLVREHILVGQGATLRLASRGGMTVRLASDDSGFVSIVAAGGSLVVAGEPTSPTVVESWSEARGSADTTTADGRAYVRVFGGRAEFTNVRFADLGFWSGITGGVSLTGTVLPDAVDAADGPFQPIESTDAVETAAEAVEGFMPLDLDTLALESDAEAESLGYASGLVQSVTFARNAFGLFVTNSDRVEVRDSLIEGSLVDGLVMHRDVSNSTVISTVARSNARDGFRLTRASTSIVLDRVEAERNGRNGITIESGPLVAGPSATGLATTVYGNNEVAMSSAIGNGRYGIEIVGGTSITVRGNAVERNLMGIVVTEGASEVSVLDNDVVDSASHGISLREAGLDLEVVGNRVDGARIGIYVRDAGGAVERNELVDVSIHGVTLIGDTGASTVVGNAISGSGPTAIDVVRTTGAAVRDNATESWQSTKPLSVVIAGVFQPLTVLWIGIGVMLILGALLSGRRRPGVHDPFADRAPLTSFTRGIVARDELARPQAV